MDEILHSYFSFSIGNQIDTVPHRIGQLYDKLHAIQVPDSIIQTKTTSSKLVFPTPNHIYAKIVKHIRSNHRSTTIYDLVNGIRIICMNDVLSNQDLRNIYLWFEWIRSISSQTCAQKPLTIYLYLTTLQKMLPKQKSQILDENNVNTAYTYSCTSTNKTNSIVIYRKEEWLKVLFHETFHTFCLDFSSMNQTSITNQIKRMFHIQANVKLYEAYTECWARILHCLFRAYTTQTTSKQTCMNVFQQHIQQERAFSLFQLSKVLDYSGLNYLNENNQTYMEDSNVFAYYVITGIMMFYYDEFVLYGPQINGAQQVKQLGTWIQTIHRRNELLESIGRAHTMLLHTERLANEERNASIKQNASYILQNLRMTIT